MSRLGRGLASLEAFLFECEGEAESSLGRHEVADVSVPLHVGTTPRHTAILAVSAAGGGASALPLAAAAGLLASRTGPSVVVADFTGSRRRGPTLLASPAAKGLERARREADENADDPLPAAARGHLCFAWASGEPGEGTARLLRGPVRPDLLCLALPAARWRSALDMGVDRALICAELPAQRSIAALAVGEARDRGLPVKVLPPLGPVAARRALAGVDPSARSVSRVERAVSRLAAQTAQATVLGIGAVAAVLTAALAFAAVSGAVSGKSRAQRAADLAAVSAARSMRDGFERLFEPPRIVGRSNPVHLERSEYLGRARAAALRAARLNGAAESRAAVSFPDRASMAPTRVKVELRGSVDLPAGRRHRFAVHAEAEIEPAADAIADSGEGELVASGGGYSGPLVVRDGERMRPDVARAFDRMAQAASRSGAELVVNSGFRSDAEQARLYARNPDPRWVAPPGRSLHRCATELDLGPPAAYGWLARNASRFGFRQRYSWEAWHYGYVAGPAPCSKAFERPPAGGNSPDGHRSAGQGLPSFVPARYRGAIAAVARRHRVSPALLAAQLMVESNFNPHAVSPAGARGIAQFMPATARGYGLDDPFDASAAIGAQARLMADLLRRFRSPALALAAYNAGPGAVERHGGIPPFRETRAYVARVLALAGGAGVAAGTAAAGPLLEVRLVN